MRDLNLLSVFRGCLVCILLLHDSHVHILKCCSTIFTFHVGKCLTFLNNNFTSATAKMFPASTIIMVLLISAEFSCHGCVAEEENRIRRPSLENECHSHHRSKVAADTHHMVSPHISSWLATIRRGLCRIGRISKSVLVVVTLNNNGDWQIYEKRGSCAYLTGNDGYLGSLSNGTTDPLQKKGRFRTDYRGISYTSCQINTDISILLKKTRIDKCGPKSKSGTSALCIAVADPTTPNWQLQATPPSPAPCLSFPHKLKLRGGRGREGE